MEEGLGKVIGAKTAIGMVTVGVRMKGEGPRKVIGAIVFLAQR